MEWLTHNPIADMQGPAFLFFYAVVIGLTTAACWFAQRQLDWTGTMPLPVIPTAPDPHEIAYLRGGENEAARSVVFVLMQKGLLRVREEGKEFLIERAPDAQPPERGALKPVERQALEWFTGARTIPEIYGDTGLVRQLNSFYAVYEHQLQREHLLTSPENSRGARLALQCGAFLIAGLGAYKLLVAFSRGRFNVIFLIILGAVGLFLLFRVCRLPRLSRRGRAYLERLHLAFDRLRYAPLAAPVPAQGKTAAGDWSGANSYAMDPTLPLLVGLYGVSSLTGTPYDYYQQPFRRAALDKGGSDNAGGAGCGSSGSSSSSGDSGGSIGDGGSGSGGGWSDSSGGGGDSGGSSCGSSCGGGCGGCGS